jgi:hypothetical protein
MTYKFFTAMNNLRLDKKMIEMMVEEMTIFHQTSGVCNSYHGTMRCSFFGGYDCTSPLLCNHWIWRCRTVFPKYLGTRSHAQEPDGQFGHKDLMPYGQINQWEFSYDAHYVTR